MKNSSVLLVFFSLAVATIAALPDCPEDYNEDSRCPIFKGNGYCDLDNTYYRWMQDNCKEACGVCQALPTTPPPTTPTPDCLADYHDDSNCAIFKGRGYCDPSGGFYSWMQSNCKEACGFCHAPTTAPTTQPPITAMPDCPADYFDDWDCPVYVGKGYCDPSSKFYGWMQDNCKGACGVCHAQPRPTTEPPPPQIVNVDPDACLTAHNAKRSLHGVPDLSWDEDLAAESAAWALKLAQNNTGLTHSITSGNYGENLALTATTDGSPGSVEEAVQLWYDEIRYYDYKNPGYNWTTGHFTQVFGILVWKSTTNLGVGIATRGYTNGNTGSFIVARYTPPGNVQGHFPENVLPRIEP